MTRSKMAQKLGEKRKRRIRTSFAAIDLGDSKSVTTILSPAGEVADSFSFTMNDEGYSSFGQRVPTNARVAFEATGMAYPVFRALKRLGYEDITVAHPKDLVWTVKSTKKNHRISSRKKTVGLFAPFVTEVLSFGALFAFASCC